MTDGVIDSPFVVALDPPATLGRAYRTYTDDERRALYDLILTARMGPQAEGELRKGWNEIAAALGVARSTLYEWRRLPDYRESERTYQQLILDETRSSTVGMAEEAVQRMHFLMYHANSSYVQPEAARELYKIAGTDRAEEATRDAGKEAMIEFQKLIETQQGRDQALKDLGHDPATIIDVEVREGGLLPEIVVAQNEFDRGRITRERRAAEFGDPREVDGCDGDL